MCSSVIVGEDAVIRYCTGIVSMGVICKVGVIDYSVSSYCGGIRDSGGERLERRGR
jgi:hypothetical protein